MYSIILLAHFFPIFLCGVLFKNLQNVWSEIRMNVFDLKLMDVVEFLKNKEFIYIMKN